MNRSKFTTRLLGYSLVTTELKSGIGYQESTKVGNLIVRSVKSALTTVTTTSNVGKLTSNNWETTKQNKWTNLLGLKLDVTSNATTTQVGRSTSQLVVTSDTIGDKSDSHQVNTNFSVANESASLGTRVVELTNENVSMSLTVELTNPATSEQLFSSSTFSETAIPTATSEIFYGNVESEDEIPGQLSNFSGTSVAEIVTSSVIVTNDSVSTDETRLHSTLRNQQVETVDLLFLSLFSAISVALTLLALVVIRRSIRRNRWLMHTIIDSGHSICLATYDSLNTSDFQQHAL